jgi:glutaconate CoA-transferase, subunit A
MRAVGLDELIEPIVSGCTLAVPADYGGVPMAATWHMLARARTTRLSGLHLITVPTGGMQADLLIGAGLVGRLQTSGITLGEAGVAPRFNAAVKAGAIDLIDSTCPAVMTGLLAAQKGVPFIPMRGLIGTDLLASRPDWLTIENPYRLGSAVGAGGGTDPIVLIPAIKPDVAFFHAPIADRDGNVWIGRRRELAEMAYASRTTLVSVEKIVETSLFDNETTAAGTLPALYVSAVALAPAGSLPYGVWGHYASDTPALAEYARQAATSSGFAAFVDRQLHALGLLPAVAAK